MCKEILVCNRCETEDIEDFVFIQEFDTVFCILCAEYFISHSIYDEQLEFSFYTDSKEKSEYMAKLLKIDIKEQTKEDEL